MKAKTTLVSFHKEVLYTVYQFVSGYCTLGGGFNQKSQAKPGSLTGYIKEGRFEICQGELKTLGLHGTMKFFFIGLVTSKSMHLAIT